MTQVNQERKWYTGLFNSFEKELNGSSETPLHRIRKQAISWFSENGFPSNRQEEWRFTNISPIQEKSFERIDEIRLETLETKEVKPFQIQEDEIRLVFVNGCLQPSLSALSALPAGVKVSGLQEALTAEANIIENNLAKHAKYDENGFVALNTAFLNRGAFIHVAKGVRIDKPIHLLYLSTKSAHERVVFPRNLIVAEEQSQVTVIESYGSLSEATCFINPVTEIVVAENANVDHYKIQQQSLATFHTALIQVHQKRDSVYTNFNIALGGSLARNDLNVILDGRGAECILNGLYLTKGDQLIDNHSVIDHAKPHCNSHELYKGILDNQARAVFSGVIHVRKDAQKTDAIQSNQNLLLSEEATVDTKPQLEIFADDVRCTHGGTVGQIEKNGVFYLRSRGLSLETAKELMIRAFAGEVTDLVKHPALRDYLETLVFSQLVGGRLKPLLPTSPNNRVKS